MKNLTFTVILAMLLSLTGFSQTFTFQVDGFVYLSAQNDLEPVYNQAVTITVDSTNTGFGYQNTVYTDQSGYFTDYIALPPDVGMAMVWVSTFDSCLGVEQVQYGYWVPGTVLPSFIFMLCGNTPPICQASFYYEQNPADPYTFNFINASLGGYDYSYWDFGDGSFSEETNPVHLYQQDGIYVVCLTISDSLQTCFDTYCLEVWVGNPVWPGCENYFFYTFIDSLTVQFEGYMVNQQQALAYEWDFGDGTSGSGQIITHTFTPGGVEYYDVCLSTMTVDSIGDTCYFTSCQPVYLFYPPECFNFFYYDQPDSLTLNFYGEAYWGQNVPPDAQYYWDFGDGTTGEGQQVSHTFPDDGNDYYMVCLTSVISDPSMDSCIAYSCQDVYLNNIPPYDCYSWFDYTNDSLTATFNGYMIYGQPAEYTWEFGDGTTGTGQQAIHTYAAEGLYYVTLTTVDSTGCSWTSTSEVWLGEITFSISGFVYLDSGNIVADEAIVRLMTMDTLWQNVIELASTTIDENGFYIFPDVEFDNFRMHFIQAELTEGSAYYGDYIPTYHLSAMNWMEAWPVWPLQNVFIDVYMLPGNPVSLGEGMITGTVSYLGVRGVLEGVEVLLLDGDMNPYTYVRTDASGHFSFSGLGYGTYIVYAELLGVVTTPAQITLDETHASSMVEITIDGNSASYEVFGIPDQQKSIAGISEIYPNPVTSRAQLTITTTSDLTLDLKLISQTGQVVRQQAYGLSWGSQTLEFSFGDLNPGIYMIVLTSSDGDQVVRRMVKMK